MKTIKVTGIGNLKVSPDLTVIEVTMSKVLMDYDTCLKASKKDLKKIKEELEKLGFNSIDIKTKFFNISSKYNSIKNKKGDYEKVFAGYEYNQILKFSFENDNKVLSNVLKVLHANVNTSVTISYTFKNKEKVKNELLKEAVKDSIEKANIISEASNTKIKGIVDIDYSWKEEDYYISPYRKYMDVCYSASCEEELDINPEDIKLEDKITVTFEIE